MITFKESVKEDSIIQFSEKIQCFVTKRNFLTKKTKEQKFEAEIFIARLSGEITK